MQELLSYLMANPAVAAGAGGGQECEMTLPISRHRLWQLATDATNASSGSTLAGFEYGAGTLAGAADAGTVTPPSKVQVCSRENFPLRNSSLVRVQVTVALCSDIRLRAPP